MAGIRHKMGICAVEGCGTHKIVARGLCDKHYQLFKRKGTLKDFARKIALVGIESFSPDNTKSCGKCKRELHRDHFGLNPSKTYPLRRKSVCKECSKAQSVSLRVKRKTNGICVYCESPVTYGSNKCHFHIRERARWRSTPKARITELLTSTRLRAEDKGLVFNLDAEWIRSRLEGVCELTGLPFDLEPGNRIGRFNPYAPSIDRRIAGGNYTPENCRMIVMALNVGMNYWGEQIYKHVAKAYLKKSRENSSKHNPQTHNLFLENPQSVRMRKH